MDICGKMQNCNKYGLRLLDINCDTCPIDRIAELEAEIKDGWMPQAEILQKRVSDLVEKILTEAGWTSPENLASEYVRLDKVVDGIKICSFPAICEYRDSETGIIGICKSEDDCMDNGSRPATVSDLIGGGKG